MCYFQHCGAVILLIFKLKEHGVVFWVEFLVSIDFFQLLKCFITFIKKVLVYFINTICILFRFIGEMVLLLSFFNDELFIIKWLCNKKKEK